MSSLRKVNNPPQKRRSAEKEKKKVTAMAKSHRVQHRKMRRGKKGGKGINSYLKTAKGWGLFGGHKDLQKKTDIA